MSVKVTKIKNIEPTPKSYLDYEWKCTKCNATTQDQVVENMLIQYKTRNLPPMVVERKCSECNTKHSMELKLS